MFTIRDCIELFVVFRSIKLFIVSDIINRIYPDQGKNILKVNRKSNNEIDALRGKNADDTEEIAMFLLFPIEAGQNRKYCYLGVVRLIQKHFCKC